MLLLALGRVADVLCTCVLTNRWRHRVLQLWALTGEQREQLGGCVARLVFCREEAPLQPQHLQQPGGVEGEPRYCYVFSRQVALPPTSPAAAATGMALATSGAVAANGDVLVVNAGPPAEGPAPQVVHGAKAADATGGLLSAGFAPGDMGVLSVEGRHVNAARVTVAAVTQVRWRCCMGQRYQLCLVEHCTFTGTCCTVVSHRPDCAHLL